MAAADQLVEAFRAAREDGRHAVLEGLHAVKHALRFGAEFVEIVCSSPAELRDLAEALAPDVADALADRVRTVDEGALARLAPSRPVGGVVGLAKRPAVDVGALIADPDPRLIVLLEDPRNLSNMGACVRVAAAADAAAVFTTGIHDPWHADALRGSAGLHFALPVAHVTGADILDAARGAGRPVVAIDPTGVPLNGAELPPRALLAFGSERVGLSPTILARAATRVAIPMREGVSSLNLATSVAVVLYAP